MPTNPARWSPASVSKPRPSSSGWTVLTSGLRAVEGEEGLAIGQDPAVAGPLRIAPEEIARAVEDVSLAAGDQQAVSDPGRFGDRRRGNELDLADVHHGGAGLGDRSDFESDAGPAW